MQRVGGLALPSRVASVENAYDSLVDQYIRLREGKAKRPDWMQVYFEMSNVDLVTSLENGDIIAAFEREFRVSRGPGLEHALRTVLRTWPVKGR
jgi:hypothetical protein